MNIRSIVCAAMWVLAASAAAPADAAGAAAGDAAALVQQGIVALHYFEYEEANETFQRAQAADPASVLACWGEAMTYHQTLWRNENLKAGRAALARLGPTPADRAAKARTPKETMMLAAAEALFGPGDADVRRQRYADAMGRAYDQERDDPDVASWYALALLGTMSRSLIGYIDAHEGHSASLAGSATQSRVNDILGAVLRAHPDHPGALHYLLHNDDDPQHARLALPAARALARLAPEASHALHMPAHIFLQLGLWAEAAASDTAAFKASDAWVARKRLPTAMRNYHALAWLQYELLQQGKYQEARATLGEIEPVVKASGQLTLLSDLGTMRARHVVETSSWNLLAKESTFANVNELFAIGLSAARSGNAVVAERARQALADKQQDPREGDLRPAIAIMERELAALIAFGAGRRDEALTILQSAADAERRLPPPLGLPAPIKPAPELYGELLIEAGRPADAAVAFRQALERNANRSLSVLGLARAAAARGDGAAARQHYEQLLANYSGADPDLPALREAQAGREARDMAPPPSGQPATRPLFWWMGLLSALGLLIVAFAVSAVAVTRLVARQTARATPKRPNRRRKKSGPA